MAFLINNTSIINDSRQLLTNDGKNPTLWSTNNWTYRGTSLFPESTTTWSSGTQNLSNQPVYHIPATNNFSDLTILINCTLITTGTQTFNDHVEVRFGGSEWQRAWNSGEAISTSSSILIQVRQFSGSYTTTGKSLIKIWRGNRTYDGALRGSGLSSQSVSTYELDYDPGSETFPDDAVEIKWPGSTASTMRWQTYAWYR